MLIVDGALNWCSFDEQIKFVKLWKSSKTATSISKEMNWSINRIYKAKKLLGLNNKLDPKHPHRGMQTKSFKKLYYKGYGLKQIANAHDVSVNTVWKRLKKHKMTFRDRHAKRNPLYSYSGPKINNLTANKLKNAILTKYDSLLSINQISKDLKVGRRTVKARLDASNVKIREKSLSPLNVKCCDFCGETIERPRANGTVKEQRFCVGTSCKSDYAYMIKGSLLARKKWEDAFAKREAVLMQN